MIGPETTREAPRGFGDGERDDPNGFPRSIETEVEAFGHPLA
jgi:hypothetical protein